MSDNTEIPLVTPLITSDGSWGDDILNGGAGSDTYLFTTYHVHSYGGTDTITDQAGDTMTLRFSDMYTSNNIAASDFRFSRDGNNLEILYDRDPDDGSTDMVTILDAYDSDPNTGTENSAFTINIEHGNRHSDTFVSLTDVWSSLV